MKKILSTLTITVMALILVACGPKQLERYEVTFNSDGGTMIAKKIVEHGGLVEKPTDPIKDGYEFEYWMDGSSKFLFSTPIEKDITLTAKWREKANGKLTIIFNTDGGSVVANQVVNKGEKLTKPTNPTKDDFIFKHWVIEGQTTAYDFNLEVTEEFTLKAIWSDKDTEASLINHFTFGSVPITGYKEGDLVWTETFGEVTASKNRVQINKSSFVPHDDLGMLVFAPIDTETKAHINFDFTKTEYEELSKIEFGLSAWNNSLLNNIISLQNARFIIEYNDGSDWIVLETVILKDLLVADTYQTVIVNTTYGKGIYRISYIAEDAKAGNTTQAVTLDNLKVYK